MLDRAFDESDAENEEISLEVDQTLAAFFSSNKRRMKVIESVLPDLEKSPDSRALYFGLSVLDAELAAMVFRMNKLPSQAISGNTLNRLANA